MMSSQPARLGTTSSPLLPTLTEEGASIAREQTPTQLDLKDVLPPYRLQRTYYGRSEEEDADSQNPNGMGPHGIVALTVGQILTPQECQSLIDMSESIGYDVAKINLGNADASNETAMHFPGYRDGYRCIVDDFAFAAQLWERVRPFVPAKFQNRPVVGLNERMRFLKYGPGDQFQAHMDGEFRRTDGSGEVTKVTIQFYLNEDCVGGATTFLEESFNFKDLIREKGSPVGEIKRVAVEPKTGQILIFQHNLLHEGSKVLEGAKYVIRSDILYGRPSIDG
ncbi:hypothetical protein BGW38_003093 [Lunasporangiospora selenospora]|uniref:Prolyl 4-hydroxylase alpha subunit domain-containing protein n=1 Tax=Lunasporangiospora selenospora TaxID=979761 RepID=A0A9P6FT80_9FUNG|nr:hypothetical protein BGW38_003093 [Lunasporangiospora selenospora]